jgi:hypothetical protein
MIKKIAIRTFIYSKPAIDITLSLFVAVSNPIIDRIRRIGLDQLPRTKRQILRAGIDLIWYTGDDPTESDISRLKPVAILFQGGLGAQIISASIYFHLRNQGYKVYADFSYFNNEKYLASVGDGRCSQWEYRLDGYKLPMIGFENINSYTDGKVTVIPDGVLKAQLFRKAIVDPEVKKYFLASKAYEILNSINFFQQNLLEPHSYVCMHVRRGDYQNSVVHYIVPESSFLAIADKFSKSYSTIIITSDSKLSTEFKLEIERKFSKVIILDDMSIDELITHSIMRLAAILICSNSQFSMTAGALSDGLAFFPTRFFEGTHQKELAQVLHEDNAKFSLLNL